VATYLDAILRAHSARKAADDRDLTALTEAARACPPPRGFARALRASSGLPDRRGRSISVIAELKRRSPSQGALALDLVPSVLAKTYASAGAACLSVLTDSEFFGGSAADLAEARSAVEVPVLRKDFTVGPADVTDARLMGADAVLLIVSALRPEELVALVELSRSVGIDALVEVHDESEAQVALDAGADLVGVNQRDLTTFEVDRERAVRVAASLPDHVTRVAESGIRGHDDVVRLVDAGFDAILVGEALVTAPDPAAALAYLLEGFSC